MGRLAALLALVLAVLGPRPAPPTTAVRSRGPGSSTTCATSTRRLRRRRGAKGARPRRQRRPHRRPRPLERIARAPLPDDLDQRTRTPSPPHTANGSPLANGIGVPHRTRRGAVPRQAPGAAAAVFDSVLASDAVARSRRASACSTGGRARSRSHAGRGTESSAGALRTMRDRMARRTRPDPAKRRCRVWLAAAARGQGDSGAWDAAQAGMGPGAAGARHGAACAATSIASSRGDHSRARRAPWPAERS